MSKLKTVKVKGAKDAPNSSKVEVSPEGFQWPRFLRDRDRIRFNTERYSNKTIAEAFSIEYDVKLQEPTEEYLESEACNITPVTVGQVINVTIENISKRGTIVSYHNSKDLFMLKQNICGWNVSPGDVIPVTVMERSRDYYVVDCIDPLYSDWLKRVSSTLSNTFQSFEVTVNDLKMLPGGYTGKIEIPEISKLMNRSYTIDAFIPGSYIALNIEKDFKAWEGKTVDAMVTNFTNKGGSFSAVCSRKKLLNRAGGMSLVQIYDAGYGRGTRFDQITFEGKVTGIINSSKKQGVFVEISDYGITGMIEKDSQSLVNYHEGDTVYVQIDKLEHDPKRQSYRRDRDGVLTEVNLKPIFVEVEQPKK